ncbi:aminoglycoside phosphotransferase [Streptacidiphilus pinicola]|uniref:Aminoglycoside phosphotransferase n=1 Tax=Streptacidiphilus pinicola TaxID=2219663 RepID=A0A2X0KF26_9ACTN|nr:aminoglycoside phosphotransferase [Streptacidiphilus pinicola]RAG85729.1 aminoglycoside phosphotransferase [Streptacidiphilus pinicola]
MADENVVNNLADADAGTDWFLLPAKVRAEVESLAGAPVVEVHTLAGARFAGLAARLRFATGARLFLKGIPTEHVLYQRYRQESAINQLLVPAGVPVPRLRHAWRTSGWWLMAFEGIAGARHPDLTPGSPDLARALGLLDRLTAAVTPAPVPEAPGFITVLGEEFRGWRQFAETAAALDPWATRNLDRLAATERFWLPYADGTILLHADLGPDTMLLGQSGTDVVVDWAYLHRGAAWIDPALFLPHLIQAGHTPEEAEALMSSNVAAWADAPPEAITFFAIALTGYWENSWRLPAPSRAPRLRPYQRQMAEIGRAWLRHRTGW